jgi:hypothetical protein
MVHPEGQPANRVVTEAFLHNRLIFSQIQFWVNSFLQLVAQQQVQLPATCELYLQLKDEGQACEYYLIDHAIRSIFWIDDGTTEELQLPPISSEDHFRKTLKLGPLWSLSGIGILLEEQYWAHVEFFPNHIKLSPSVENEVRSMLTHSAVGESGPTSTMNALRSHSPDNFTSDQSTAAYTIEQCITLLNLMGSIPSMSPLHYPAIAYIDGKQLLRQTLTGIVS